MFVNGPADLFGRTTDAENRTMWQKFVKIAPNRDIQLKIGHFSAKILNRLQTPITKTVSQAVTQPRTALDFQCVFTQMGKKNVR